MSRGGRPVAYAAKTRRTIDASSSTISNCPGVAENSAIAVSAATSMATIADYACHSAAHFFGAILSLHLADETANTNQDRVGSAVVHRLDFDSLERKPLMKPRQIFH